MKKILLLSIILISTILLTNNKVFAQNLYTQNNSYKYVQHLEKLFEKIQKDTLLSTEIKMKCLITFEKQLSLPNPAELNFEQKKKINGCINIMYSKKFEVMKSKVEKLKNLITSLKKSGDKVTDLEKSLEQAEAGLRLLKAAL
jgi:hypothetical protein